MTAELAVDLAEHAHREQRVAAELEEVVVHAHVLDAQDPAPDRGDHRLLARPRSATVARSPGLGGVGCAQRATVDLPVRGDREPLHLDERRRDHELGDPLPQRDLESDDVEVPAVDRHQVGDQARPG